MSNDHLDLHPAGNGFTLPTGLRIASLSERLPPHNLDAERGVLGGLLLDPGQLDAVRRVLDGRLLAGRPPGDLRRDPGRGQRRPATGRDPGGGAPRHARPVHRDRRRRPVPGADRRAAARGEHAVPRADRAAEVRPAGPAGRVRGDARRGLRRPAADRRAVPPPPGARRPGRAVRGAADRRRGGPGPPRGRRAGAGPLALAGADPDRHADLDRGRSRRRQELPDVRLGRRREHRRGLARRAGRPPPARLGGDHERRGHPGQHDPPPARRGRGGRPADPLADDGAAPGRDARRVPPGRGPAPPRGGPRHAGRRPAPRGRPGLGLPRGPGRAQERRGARDPHPAPAARRAPGRGGGAHHAHEQGVGGKAIYRAMGSLAFGAAARVQWLVAQDRHDPDRLLLLHAKDNIGTKTTNLAYQLVDGMVQWEAEAVRERADDVLAAEGQRGAPGGELSEPLRRAMEWVREQLAIGPQRHADLRTQADRDGIAKGTFYNAVTRLEAEHVIERFALERRNWFRLATSGGEEADDAPAF